MRASGGVLFVLLLGCAPSRPAHIQEIAPVPAYWVEDNDGYEPDAGDFTFDALAFPSADQGWFIGDRYVLHLNAGKLEVVFAASADTSLNTVAFSTAEQGWAAGSRVSGDQVQGVIWQFASDRWREADVSQVVNNRWWLDDLCASSDGAAWATAHAATGPGDQSRPEPLLLRLHHDAWEIDRAALGGDGQRRVIVDCCFGPEGPGWFVGRQVSPIGGARGVAVRNASELWQEVLPLPLSADSALHAVACLPDGGVVVLGSEGPRGADRLVVLVSSETWRRIELPERFGTDVIGALAAISPREFWIALNSVSEREKPRILRWKDGTWFDVPTPELPEGRKAGYVFTDMQFVSPDEGWATALDYDGPGLRRGLIFHYKDGVWRNRNWNWHFWDQPGFGLLGE